MTQTMSDTLSRAADFLEQYADFIRREVMSVDIEQHPYLPELEEIAAEVRAHLASAASAPVGVSDARILELAKDHTWFNGSHAMTNYVNFARALLAEAVSAPVDAWRPIATAPKDGTRILGFCPDFGIRETKRSLYTPGSPGYADWQAGKGPLDHSWYWCEEYHRAAHSWQPTHWMPLPPAPTEVQPPALPPVSAPSVQTVRMLTASEIDTIADRNDGLGDHAYERELLDKFCSVNGLTIGAHVSAPVADSAKEGADALAPGELDLLDRILEDFCDCGETDVSYDVLMDFARRGYLVCERFTTTAKTHRAFEMARLSTNTPPEDSAATKEGS